MVNTDVEPATQPPTTRRRFWVALVVAAVVAALVTGGALSWFFSSDAPAAVDLEATAAAVTATTAASQGADIGIEGTWSVDDGVGEFTVTEDTTATFAGFRVNEELSSIGAATAVGRTPGVTGSIEIDGTTLTRAEIVADLTAIVSDQSRREGAIQTALDTATHPDATFFLTEPIELGDAAAAGEVVDVTATGDLTTHGITHTVQILLQAQLIDGSILITGSTEIVFADYGITAPAAPIVLSVEDHGILEFQLWMTR